MIRLITRYSRPIQYVIPLPIGRSVLRKYILLKFLCVSDPRVAGLSPINTDAFLRFPHRGCNMSLLVSLEEAYVQVDTLVQQIINEIEEAWAENIADNIKQLEGRHIVLGLLSTAGLILTTLEAKAWISSNVAKWSGSLLLSGQLFYGVCLMVGEIKDYLRLGAMREELSKVLNDTWRYVDSRQQQIDEYMKEIQRIFKDLSMADDGDVNNKKLVKEFDYNVHMMLLLIHECQRQLQSTEAILGDLELDLQKIESLGYGEISMLYGGMAGPVRTAFSIHPGLGVAAGAVVGVALVGTVVAKILKEGKRDKIKNDIKETRDGIANLRRTWNTNVGRVQAHIEFLKDKGFPVKDMPKWFMTPISQ